MKLRWVFPSMRSRMRFDLSSLLLLVTLCSCAMGYYAARAHRLRTTDQLNYWLALKGLPTVADVTECQWIASSNRDEKVTVWVPHHQQLRLYWATQIDDRSPTSHSSVVLEEGMHQVRLRQFPQMTELVVDESSVLSKRHSKTWNLSPPITWEKSGVEVLTAPSTLILDNRGVTTLDVDEPFDPSKHTFGLRIWLVQQE